MNNKKLNPHFIQRLFFLWFLALMVSHNVLARESVCAQVKIEIQQEASLERQAFDAVMKINNGLETASLDNIEITVQFTDDQNNPIIASSDPNNTNARFFIKIDSMKGVTDVNGSGEILASTSAEIHWLIIPAPGSGGNIPGGKAYNVGATLKYKLGQTVEEVTVIPDVIYVKPLPSITLDYFLTRQVVADDPFTPVTEVSEPFTLGVRVSNHGQALARQFKIDSAQPKIIENEQGLLINFNLVGSTVDDQPVEPDLLLDFGDIPGNSSRIGRWWMITTLAGQFTEFTATWSHADELGGQLTSIMDAVNTHFLIHDVQVDLPGRDSILDFLALDGAQARVYESENIDTLVNNLDSQSTLTFKYLLNNQDYYDFTMPANGGFIHSKKEITATLANGKAISQVIRSDNKVLKKANAWISKEGSGANGWTYYINLFDFNTPGAYTLIFGEKINTNQAPVIEFIAYHTAWTEKNFNLSIKASDPDNTIPVMTALNLPAGASFIDQGNGTGLFSWTPTLAQAGQYRITYQAGDGAITTERKADINVIRVEDRDKDNDGMDDDWELEHFGTLDHDGLSDYDNDGISDRDEFLNGTDPAQFNTTELPVIHAPEIGGEINQLSTVLSLTNAQHEAGLTVHYHFQLFADEALTQLIEQSALISETDNQTQWTPRQPLKDNHWYTWRVRAHTSERYSQWVTGDFFVNTANESPTIPVILTPLDGTQVSSTTPALEVSPATDRDGDTLNYRFILYSDAGKTVEIDRLEYMSPGSEVSLIKWSVSTPLNNGQQYYWQVQVDDGDGGIINTPLVSFTIDSSGQSPGVPLLVEPAVDSRLMAGDIDMILGNSSEPESTPLSYYVELDRQKDFNSPDKQQTTLEAGLSRTTWSLIGLMDNSPYYWRARAFDGSRYSDWIQGAFFINLENDAPETPVVKNPGHQAWVTTSRPVLQIAHARDKDGDAVSYEYELYEDPELTIPVGTIQSTSVNWPLEQYLADYRWYYWRVRSLDPQGASSDWSPLSSFFVNDNSIDSEPVITLLTPSEQNDGDGRYLIRWSDEDPDSNARINLYFGQNTLISQSSLIVEDLQENADASGDRYLFDTRAIAPGDYYIMATISDDTSTTFNIAPGILSIQHSIPDVVLSSDMSGQLDAGSEVILSASVINDVQSLFNYRFILKSELSQNQTQVLQDWSLSPVYSWDTTGLQGGFNISVEARRETTTGPVGSDEQRFTLIDPDKPPATAVTLYADKVSPQRQASPITLTAQAEGGSGVYEYRYQIKGDATLNQWQAIDHGLWTENNSVRWDTTNYAGYYDVKVSARNKDSLDPAVSTSTYFEITAQSTLMNLSRNSSVIIKKGDRILITVTAADGTDMYEYRFQIKGESTGYQYQTLQDWSAINTLEWNSRSYTGGYTLQVEQRISGSTMRLSQDTLWFKIIKPDTIPMAGIIMLLL